MRPTSSERSGRRVPAKKTVIAFEEPVFFSVEDEDHFFKWLYSISAFKNAKGAGFELSVTLKTSRPSRRDVRQLVSLFSRYEIDLRHLRLLFDSTRDWLPKLWADAVFGRSGTIKPAAIRGTERFRSRVIAAQQKHAARAAQK